MVTGKMLPSPSLNPEATHWRRPSCRRLDQEPHRNSWQTDQLDFRQLNLRLPCGALTRTRGKGQVGMELSRRQSEVLPLIAAGLTDGEVGSRLGISARTARAHAEALKQKLGVARRREIAVAFRRMTGCDPFEAAKESDSR